MTCGENMAEPDRIQMAILRMRIARWITKAINTHSDYVILTAYQPQQCLHGHTSVLRRYVHFLPCLLSTERPIAGKTFNDA